jgi:thiol-disulfide isomerase/thioredoxin
MKTRHWFAGLTTLTAAALAGCGAATQTEPQPDTSTANEDAAPQEAVQPAEPPIAPLDNFGPAPEITNDVWLNTDMPIRLADQRGKVVLVEFWTFGCINCQRVIPSVRDWYNTYSDQGLVVVGVHYPEFSYEREVDNVRDALVRLDVPYPVTIDNDRVTWSAYNQRFWPTTYLIDKQGDIRYVHIGEGAYDETERTIQALLAEPAPET